MSSDGANAGDEMTDGFATTPEPPYYVVVFSSRRTGEDAGYADEAQALFELAMRQEGCLGAETARGPDGFGITTAYFSDEAAIARWREDGRHLAAQRRGKDLWYSRYAVRIAKVERAYEGPQGR